MKPWRGGALLGKGWNLKTGQRIALPSETEPKLSRQNKVERGPLAANATDEALDFTMVERLLIWWCIEKLLENCRGSW